MRKLVLALWLALVTPALAQAPGGQTMPLPSWHDPTQSTVTTVTTTPVLVLPAMSPPARHAWVIQLLGSGTPTCTDTGIAPATAGAGGMTIATQYQTLQSGQIVSNQAIWCVASGSVAIYAEQV